MLKGPKSYRNLRLPSDVQVERKPRPVPTNIRGVGPSETAAEPGKSPEPIEPPTWLGSRAKKIFAIKAAQIQSSGYWEPRFEESLALLSTLLSEYRRAPSKMSSARLTQMRLLLSELGLTPQSSRGVDRR